MPPRRAAMWTILVKVMHAYVNTLKSRHSLRFPRTLLDAIIYARRVPAAMGQGHNGAQSGSSGVVSSVVGKRRSGTKAYPPPTTPQRQIATLSRMCMHACARVWTFLFFRCAVVSISYVTDIYRERGTTLPTTQGQNGQKPLCAPLWALLNPLKNNKKGGIYAQA